ncbi:hypothetical protein Pan44_24010 [Caulifigura coniformis]|uniref:Uncharacterized protein n=1 Tax=Caulifigura coniformis TaxID=2527983 RepID=A0A517SE29_9PLAN|nr:hypothetical protein Pan44_24010 [Caulifigura coniformis]
MLEDRCQKKKRHGLEVRAFFLLKERRIADAITGYA